MARVFIDGQAGTTGLQITERLTQHTDIDLVYLDDAARKDPQARQSCLHSCDVAVLCLPDDAAREAVTMADGQTRILDASTAHRVDAAWTYGLPELEANAREKIRSAQFVSNPGCYPQGFILLVRPLIEAGLLTPTIPLSCNAVSGYSGGGRTMIESFGQYDTAEADRLNCQLYGLDLQHKHVPEMQRFSLVTQRPLFTPMVANYYQGMLVQIPLFAAELNGASRHDVHAVLAQRYQQEAYVQVVALDDEMPLHGKNLIPTQLNHSNLMQLLIFGNDEQMLLVARYDNLGKGAAGAAVQNLNLMLGLDEHIGLTTAAGAA